MAYVRLVAVLVSMSLSIACGSDSSDPGGDDTPDAAGTGLDAAGGGGSPDASPNCAADPAPPGSDTCPPECTECLAGNVCRIACETNECKDTTIVCPADYACEIVCTGEDACDSSVVECPATYACSIACDGPDACGDIEMACGGASCGISCASDSCSGATVECGSGACNAACTGTPAPTLDCTAACGCSECAP